VKKTVSILLFSAYLISATEIYQILKLPLLLEHYNEHKFLNEGTTLWSFLIIHYTNNDIKYADYEEDMRLPFKSHEGCANALSLSFIQNFTSIKIRNLFEKERKIYVISNDNILNSTYLSTIWQPPKFS
jgi:hypothetical protein